MLKNRLIPCLLIKDGRCVKGVNFSHGFRDTGYPVTAAKIYDAQGADELLFLDIMANREGRCISAELVSKVAESCFVPLTVGGGITSLEQIKLLLKAGADKVSINTYAVENPGFITAASNLFGRQCVVVSIDVKLNNGKYEVFTHSGTKPTGLDPSAFSKEMVKMGAGELLVTSVDNEGTMKGYDLPIIRQIADSVDVPVIASGGAGTLQHLVDAIKKGHADSVCASSIFHFTDQSVIKARGYMKEAGINVRTVF